MADNENKTEATQEGAKSGPGIVVWLLVAVAAGVGGAAVPVALDVIAGTSKTPPRPINYAEIPPATAMTFLHFGEITANLDEGRMNRYLRLKIALHVRKSDQELISKKIAEKELMLKNWLLSHLSDKELNHIRGKAGQNALRREIRDYFNTTLFDDHYDRIYDILFEEFNVQ